MPRIEDIEQFKGILDSLGDEPAVLADKGETISPVEKPEPGLSADLSAMLKEVEAGMQGVEGEEAGEAEAGSAGQGEDFAFQEAMEESPPQAKEPEELSEEDFSELASLGEEGAEPAAPGAAEEFSPSQGAAGGEEDWLENLDAFMEPELAREETPEAAAAQEVPGEEVAPLKEEIPVPEEARSPAAGEFAFPEEADSQGEQAEPSREDGEGAPEQGGVDQLDRGEIDAIFPEQPEKEAIAAPGEPGPQPDGFAEEDFGIPLEELAADNIQKEAVSAEEESFGPVLGGEGPESLEEFALPEEPFGLEEEIPAAGEAAGEEDFSLPQEPPAGEETAAAGMEGEEFPFPPEEEEGPEALSQEDFSIPEGFPFEEASQAEQVPEETGPPPAEEQPFSMEDEFSIPDFEEEKIEESGMSGLEEGQEPEVDEFDLGDLGEHFGIGEEAKEEISDFSEISLPVSEEKVEEAVLPSAPERQIGEDEFKAIRRTLAEQPRNLKIQIEELIGEKALSGDALEKLLKLLVEGAAPRELAALVAKITGKKITIPAQYEKRTGLEFEEKQATLAYRFKQNILPILRMVALAVLFMGLLAVVGWFFVYPYVNAGYLYAKGYEEIQENRFLSGKNMFDRALKSWKLKGQFYRFATAYQQKTQYEYARDIYQSLKENYGVDKRGFLAWAAMESRQLGDYQKADQILTWITDLDRYRVDKATLLAKGENYLLWGEERQLPDKYEKARETFGLMRSRYGDIAVVVYGFLQYFMKTDKQQQVETLVPVVLNYKQADAQVFSELAAYLINQGKLEYVKELLDKAIKANATLPAANYQLARYFSREEDPREIMALDNTLAALTLVRPLSKKQEIIEVEAMNLKGEYLMGQDKDIEAEDWFNRAIKKYEAGRAIYGQRPEFGKIYANLADVYYYKEGGQYDYALSLYKKAEANLYSTPSLKYKEGFIQYIHQDYKKALLDFYNAGGTRSVNRNLMLATGNTLYKDGEYFAAQGYYSHFLSLLEQEKSGIPLLRPREDPEHLSLLLGLIRGYNNLGVTLKKIAARSADPQKEAGALYYLTSSTEYYDQLRRDPETLERSGTKDLAAINMRAILYPVPGQDVQIYISIPKDMREYLQQSVEDTWLERF